MCILSPLMDNRFSNAWVLLGHVLAAQEESEHAISAYRTACRVLPGNHEPQVFMAKELVSAHGYPHHHPHPPPPPPSRPGDAQIRTNNYSLALHVLTEALELCPNDPAIMNELGVVYLQLNRLEEALGPFRKAAEGVLTSGKKGAKRKNTSGAIEVSSIPLMRSSHPLRLPLLCLPFDSTLISLLCAVDL
jgi:tetratricopeptide (TPR) repeat protein